MVGDREQAAAQFMTLCRGERHLRVVLNLEAAPDPDVIQADVAAAVKAFTTLYRSVKGDRGARRARAP
jgi:hypothetical protein